jgi:hypothetical protein
MRSAESKPRMIFIHSIALSMTKQSNGIGEDGYE